MDARREYCDKLGDWRSKGPRLVKPFEVAAALLMPTPFARRGFCLVLSSPSGAGKTTIAKLLIERDSNLRLSVSVTTRRPRPEERDGFDYVFASPEKFQSLKESGALLEWAEVFGNHYGTPAAPVRQALEEGRDVLFDIDWQGARSISRILPDDVVRVFILPPSREELARRIYGRGADKGHVIEARLRAADEEMTHFEEYDYVIVNRDLEASVAALKAIVDAERLKRARLTGVDDFVRGLMVGPEAAPPGKG